MKNESIETETDRRGAAAEADGMLAAMEASDIAMDETVEPTGPYLKGLIEAVLFVSDHPLELKDVARAARIDRARTLELLEELVREYEGRGIRLELVAGGYAFRSSPDYAERVRQYLALRPVRLSRAQLETLAIVAYRQPITRPEIDEVRGVDSGPVLKGLLERDLVRIIGKKDEPGRPMLYGTTGGFLEAFSLKSLRDLPTLREYTELSEESRRVFESELGEPAPEGPLEQAEEAKADSAGDAPSASAGADEPAPTSGPGDEDDEDKDEDDEDDEDEDDEDEDDEDKDDEDKDDEDKDDEDKDEDGDKDDEDKDDEDKDDEDKDEDEDDDDDEDDEDKDGEDEDGEDEDGEDKDEDDEDDEDDDDDDEDKPKGPAKKKPAVQPKKKPAVPSKKKKVKK